MEAGRQRLEERVVVLEAELEAEREGRRMEVGRLQREEKGRASRLEAALKDCREELRGHVTKAKEGSTHQTLLLRQVRGSLFSVFAFVFCWYLIVFCFMLVCFLFTIVSCFTPVCFLFLCLFFLFTVVSCFTPVCFLFLYLFVCFLQVESLSKEMRQKDKELGKKVEREVQLQQDLASLRAELQQGHVSWQEAKEDLKNRLILSESAREGLLRQLAEASREATLQSARLGGTEEVMGELERCRGEVQRLEGVVSSELAQRGKMEAEVRKWRREKEKFERRCTEGVARQEAADKRWQEERSAKEACEAEGEELRKEVGRLSEELLKRQHQLQAEMEGRADKEKETEDSLTHLQQELAKRAQQVFYLMPSPPFLLSGCVFSTGVGDGPAVARASGGDHGQATPIGAHPDAASGGAEGAHAGGGAADGAGRGLSGQDRRAESAADAGKARPEEPLQWEPGPAACPGMVAWSNVWWMWSHSAQWTHSWTVLPNSRILKCPIWRQSLKGQSLCVLRLSRRQGACGQSWRACRRRRRRGISNASSSRRR